MNARKTNLEKFAEALAQLEKALAEPETAELALDGTIQRFEFSFELGWKSIKDILFSAEGVEAKTPKSALKEAYRLEWITNEQFWLKMLEDRNNTSHTYNKLLAGEIYGRIKEYHPELMRILQLLQKKEGEGE